MTIPTKYVYGWNGIEYTIIDEWTYDINGWYIEYYLSKTNKMRETAKKFNTSYTRINKIL